MITYLALVVGAIAVVYVLSGSIRRRQPASEWLSSPAKAVLYAVVIALFAISILSWVWA